MYVRLFSSCWWWRRWWWRQRLVEVEQVVLEIFLDTTSMCSYITASPLNGGTQSPGTELQYSTSYPIQLEVVEAAGSSSWMQVQGNNGGSNSSFFNNNICWWWRWWRWWMSYAVGGTNSTGSPGGGGGGRMQLELQQEDQEIHLQ